MAAEALAGVLIKDEMSRLNLTEKAELASHWSIKSHELTAKAIRTLICKNDEIYAAARKASDGFEHGYSSYKEIRAHAQKVKVPLAKYIREAILSVLKVPEEDISILTATPFDEPLTPINYIKSLHGKIHGNHDRLAADGTSHPFFQFKNAKLEKCTANNGLIQYEGNDTLTLCIHPEAKFLGGMITMQGQGKSTEDDKMELKPV